MSLFLLRVCPLWLCGMSAAAATSTQQQLRTIIGQLERGERTSGDVEQALVFRELHDICKAWPGREPSSPVDGIDLDDRPLGERLLWQVAKLAEQQQQELVACMHPLQLCIADKLTEAAAALNRWLGEAEGQDKIDAYTHRLVKLLQGISVAPWFGCFRQCSDMTAKADFLLAVAFTLRAVGANGALHGRVVPSSRLVAATRHLSATLFQLPEHGNVMEDWLDGRLERYNQTFWRAAKRALLKSKGDFQARLLAALPRSAGKVVAAGIKAPATSGQLPLSAWPMVGCPLAYAALDFVSQRSGELGDLGSLGLLGCPPYSLLPETLRRLLLRFDTFEVLDGGSAAVGGSHLGVVRLRQRKAAVGAKPKASLAASAAVAATAPAAQAALAGRGEFVKSPDATLKLPEASVDGAVPPKCVKEVNADKAPVTPVPAHNAPTTDVEKSQAGAAPVPKATAAVADKLEAAAAASDKAPTTAARRPQTGAATVTKPRRPLPAAVAEKPQAAPPAQKTPTTVAEKTSSAAAPADKALMHQAAAVPAQETPTPVAVNPQPRRVSTPAAGLASAGSKVASKVVGAVTSKVEEPKAVAKAAAGLPSASATSSMPPPSPRATPEAGGTPSARAVSAPAFGSGKQIAAAGAEHSEGRKTSTSVNAWRLIRRGLRSRDVEWSSLWAAFCKRKQVSQELRRSSHSKELLQSFVQQHRSKFERQAWAQDLLTGRACGAATSGSESPAEPSADPVRQAAGAAALQGIKRSASFSPGDVSPDVQAAEKRRPGTVSGSAAESDAPAARGGSKARAASSSVSPSPSSVARRRRGESSRGTQGRRRRERGRERRSTKNTLPKSPLPSTLPSTLRGFEGFFGRGKKKDGSLNLTPEVMGIMNPIQVGQMMGMSMMMNSSLAMMGMGAGMHMAAQQLPIMAATNLQPRKADDDSRKDKGEEASAAPLAWSSHKGLIDTDDL